MFVEWLHEVKLKLRNNLLTNQRFQRWASSSFITKSIARRKANALFDICAGFVYSQVLYTCVKLDVFKHIATKPLTLEELAKEISLPIEATDQLLIAAKSLNLVEEVSKQKYTLGELGAAYLGNPGIESMIRHHEHFYADLNDPIALLRGEAQQTQLANFWGYSRIEDPLDLTTQQVTDYTNLMSDSMQLLAEDILETYSFRQHKKLLDLAGGNGTFLLNVCKQWPHLEAVLFDLPAVIKKAEENLSKHQAKISTVAGNLFESPLPAGADVISLVRVLHDHDDEFIYPLLRKILEVLQSKGTLLIAEPMAGSSGSGQVGDVYFVFYLLAMQSGKPRSPQLICEILDEIGFDQIKVLKTPRPLITQAIIAQKP